MSSRMFIPLAPGMVLVRRYKILGLIRQGGMGTTYRGEDLDLRKTVAVKQLLERFLSPREREAGIHDFLTEMAVLKSIRHPRIPKILDHFVSEKNFFFVLEFIHGSDFSRILSENRSPLPEEDVARAGIQVCRILQYLHNLKPDPVFHLDIKPSNIMRETGSGKIVLLDFGIARAQKPEKGMMIGTPGYAAPEQHEQQGDGRSDIFSLGASLHELATGRRPDAETFDFPAPREIRPELTARFSQVILTALRRSPEERFADARAFENALQSLLPAPLPPEEESPFREHLRRFQNEIFLPGLAEIQRKFPGECHPENRPRILESCVLSLGSRFPHCLIVDVDERRETVVFHQKEGLLPVKPLGEIHPGDPSAGQKFAALLKHFMETYKER